jgi:plastocyanin
VTISGFKFAPAKLTVNGGGAVAVTNHDDTAHTATADDGSSFDTGDVNPGSSKTIRVSKPGSYAYHCSIHPFMKGTLVVPAS